MGTHSGIHGNINSISTVMDFSVSDTQAPQQFVASNTLNGNATREGVNDWTGSYNALGGTPLVLPGQFFAFAGYTAPNDDVLGVDGQIATGNAIVDTVTINWDWSSGAIISHSVGFSGNLALVIASGSATVDATAPTALPVCPTIIDYGADTSEIELDNVQSATLTITAANSAFVNSSTIVGSTCWTGRKAGPINFTMSAVLQDDTQVAALVKGTNERFRLYVDGTDFWELLYCHVGDWSDLDVNPATGTIITQTLNTVMSGVLPAGTLGRITLPGADPTATVYWGALKV